MWAGVDVGGKKKGFDVAVLSDDLDLSLDRVGDPERCIDLVRHAAVAAVDAPSGWAEAGHRSRACERAFFDARVCSIRYTPDEATAGLRTDRYYEWVEQGLELWAALEGEGIATIECFPTASWTRWIGRRGRRRRAKWTRDGFCDLAERLGGSEVVRNQDHRDAVAAALTARQWDVAPASLECFDGLVVPQPGTLETALGV